MSFFHSASPCITLLLLLLLLLKLIGYLLLNTTPRHQLCLQQSIRMQLMDREKLYILPNFGGGIYLAYGGFVFKEDTPGRAPPGTTYWACSRVHRATRTKPAVYCPARLTVYGDISGDENQLLLLKAPKPHVCGEENAEGHRLRMQMDSLVCSGALGPRSTAADVYDEFTVQAPQEVLNQLPSRETCLEHIRRTMQRNDPRPPVPRCRYGFDIPPKYTRATFTSESGGAVVEEQILQFDSGRNDTNRYLIFASRSHIEMIARGQDGGLHLSVDGTFAACCPLWGQQYGVLVKHKDCFVMSPCAFILMPSRKKSVYDLVFNDLLQLFTGIKITSCIADFEEHAVRSFKEVFNSRQDLVAEVKISLCFFHFSKNVLLRFKRLRMFHSAHKHLRDRRARCFYNILALAFLPTHLVPAGLLVGCKELDTADYDFVVSYLSQYYTRPNSVFPVEEWNMRDRVLSGLCRSTNSQEAFHRVWGKEVGVNPNIWEWIENTARFIAKERVKVGNLDRGDRPRRKNYYEVTDASLHALVNLPVDEASLESWFQSARTHLRRLTPPGGDEVRPEIDPFPYPWEEATPQTATTGPCRFGTQNTWQSSANDGGSYASPAGLASNTSQPVGSSSSACTPIPGASSSRSHPYSLSAAGVFPPSCQQSVLTNDPSVSPSIPGAPTHLARQNVWQSIPTGNGNGRRTVTLEDLADLGREGTSLSDSVVDFWMSLLVARKKLSPPPRPLAGMFLHQDTPSSLPSLSQAAVTSTTLFMQPLFDSAENHSACTVVKRGRIYYCDSSCMSSQPSNGMMELLRRIYGAEAEVTVLPTQQQTPMSALCGAFTLAFCTEFLLGGVQPGKVNLRESDMRNHIIACVEERRAKQFPRMLPGDEPPIFSRRKKIKL